MIDRLLTMSARLACRAPKTILLIATLAAAASVAYAVFAPLKLNADTDDLIARDRPFMDDYLSFLEEFGDLEFLYVVIQHDRNPRRAEQAIDFLGPRLREIELLPAVYDAIEPEEQLQIATRAMSDQELGEFVLAADAYGTLRVQPGATTAMNRAGELLRELLREGRRRAPAERERLAASAIMLLQSVAAGRPDSNSEHGMAELLNREANREYIRSESGGLYFILIMPVKDYGTMSVIDEPLRRIRAAIDEARAAFPDLEMGLTGKPVLQADEMATTDRDMRRAAILAVFLVAILFMIVIGGVWHPLLGVVALLYGIAWTFGLTTLVIGQLNLLSIVFTLVLVGVGIDFGVHLIARYKEALRESATDDAIRIALTTAGRGNVTGAITSSIAFFMAMFTDFQGLRELGFIAGCGLLLCLLAMTIVLPAFLIEFDRRRARRPGNVDRFALPRNSVIEDRLWNRLMARPGAVLMTGVLFTAVISPGFLRIGFDANLLDLQAAGLESVKWERRILDESAETWFAAVIVESQAEAMDVIERAHAHEWINGTQSIFDVIQPRSPVRMSLRETLQARSQPIEHEPAEEDDSLSASEVRGIADMIAIMARGAEERSPDDAAMLRELRGDLVAIANDLLEAGAEERTELLDRLDRAVNAIGGSLEMMLHGDSLPLRDALPRAVRDRFISPHGRYLVKLHPTENVWDYEPMQRFVRAIREIDARATGVPITQFESFNDMRRAFAQAAIFAFIAVFLLIWIDQRRLHDAALAVLPLVVAMVWLVALMGIFGVRFNLANFFAVPILIGIGVDSGIHILRRYHEGEPTRLELGSTRRAVFLTAMTSMIGFGMLATATHLGLRSLGHVMVLGCLATLVASLVLLPAFLAWCGRVRGRAE